MKENIDSENIDYKIAMFIAILISSCLIFASCGGIEEEEKEVKIDKIEKEALKQINDTHTENLHNYVDMTKIDIDNIEYHIYASASSYSGVFVINHTKELLEVERLKQQIKYEKSIIN